jgi:hypothetical protein
MYVRHQDDWAKVHGGSFGEAVGGLYVSPQAKAAFVERRFEGGSAGGVLIDLDSGRMQHVWASPDLTAWNEHSWHTQFEHFSRDELHKALGSGDPRRAETAKRELEIRGVESRDLPALASAFMDGRLPETLRHHMVFVIVEYEGHASEDVIATIAKGLNTPEPAHNLSAAWALGELAEDAPMTVDIYYGGSEKVLQEKHRRYVPLFRAWWESRPQEAAKRDEA